MLKLEALIPAADADDGAALPELVLPYADRVRSRLRVTLSDGREAAVLLPRGSVMRHGDVLAGSEVQVRVVAESEPVYAVTARADSALPGFDLLRGAYHLGNRHIPLMLSPEKLVLERDPVLRDMLHRLDLVVGEAMGRFDPEPGAYGGGHRHDHDPSGGSLGELLSQQAHGEATPDLSGLAFKPDRGL